MLQLRLTKVKAYVKHIDDIKLFLEKETGGRFGKGESSEGQLQGRDNMEKHAHYFINEGKGADLKKLLIHSALICLLLLRR